MQKIYFVAVLLLISVAFANAQNAVLKGVVTQKSNQQPMPGASVYFSGTTTGTATNNKGEFQIKNVKPGEYDLVVSFSGYSRQKQRVALTEGNNVLNFTMEESKSQLGEIVVTGTGTAHHLKTAPVQTELISKKAIASTGASDFNELMMSVSPSFDFNPSTMGARMTINGLGNDFILVLIDGKRVYGDVGGNTDLNRINPDDIERIEVLKGAASLLYGSDAIAGVVNVITKKSKQKINLSNTTRIRKYATIQQSNTIDLNLGKFSWNGNFNRKSSDGWQLSPYEIDDDELVETEAMAQNKYEDKTFSHSLTFRATDKLEVYAGNSYYEKDMYRPQSVGKYGYHFTDKTFEAGAKYLLNKKDYISVDYNYDRFRYYYRYNQEYKDYQKGDKSINNDQRMNNFRFKYVNSLSDKNTLTIGADYLQEEMVSEDRLVDGKADANTFALYAQEEIKLLERLELVAGSRFVKHKEFGSAFTPKVSLLYKLDQFNFRGTYGYGFKAPTVKELYYAYEKRGTLYLGNTDLDPQKSQFSSLGIEFHNDFLTASITGYINNVDDLIAYESVDLEAGDAEDGIKRRKKHYNVEESRSQGIDFLLNARLGAGFTLGGGYSYVDAKDLTTDERLDGVAQHYGNVRLAYDRSWKNYSFNANIVGRIQDEKSYDNNTDNAKAYDIWKLTTNHRFMNLGSFIIEAQLGIDNIFDQVDDSPYGSHYGTLSPGRTFFAGFTINFAK
ncbi:TonB-dependent receptor [Marinifilum caeruleilacunae]|uniref:TonB-dependent receptor n=1 Tax=Marinifilum caeruleilacunae TaxID=2499076 RepID=A0ABX1WYI5_9BACT|nr:TonB-dependent receptor [Marinifilum caeruleilacunae]NOU61134.1 TonB-dependent receptor [Marinifilum caeruleilacunae]